MFHEKHPCFTDPCSTDLPMPSVSPDPPRLALVAASWPITPGKKPAVAVNPREKCRGTAFSHREKCEFVEKHEEMEKRMEHIYYIIYILYYISTVFHRKWSMWRLPIGPYSMAVLDYQRVFLKCRNKWNGCEFKVKWKRWESLEMKRIQRNPEKWQEEPNLHIDFDL